MVFFKSVNILDYENDLKNRYIFYLANFILRWTFLYRPEWISKDLTRR